MASNSPEPDLLDGTPYAFEKTLGKGGMGVVVSAVHRGTGARVAIKLLHAHLGEQEGLVDRLRIEGTLMHRLESQHLVRVTDTGVTARGEVFIVMEMLTGRSLADVIRASGPQPWREAVRILREALVGLAVVHAAGVVHRDLKPGNLFMCDGFNPPRCKVLDFGIAKIIDNQDRKFALPMQPTAPGAVIGSPRYMSPEQARGEPVDHRSDLYSMGVVFYALLAGRGPFDEKKDFIECCRAHALEAPPPIAAFTKNEVPEAVAQVLQKALAKKATDRFVNAPAFISALDALVAPPKPTPEAQKPSPAQGNAPHARPPIQTPGYLHKQVLTPGQQFGKYVISDMLGKGGMGEVYLAQDSFLDRPVAIKVLPLKRTADPLFRERMQREAAAGARVVHPHLVRIFDGGVTPDDVVFVVMEYLGEHTTLRHLIHESAPFAYQQWIRIGIQIADGLMACHAASIAHRDLKPENIVLQPGGHVKIIDFGLAKIRSSALRTTMGNAPEKNKRFATPLYASPEQLGGASKDVTEKTDIWALGCVLYEMAMRRHVWQTEADELPSAQQVTWAMQSRSPASLRDANLGLPVALTDLVDGCLKRDPKERPTATDLAHGLRQALSAKTPSTTTDPLSGARRGSTIPDPRMPTEAVTYPPMSPARPVPEGPPPTVGAGPIFLPPDPVVAPTVGTNIETVVPSTKPDRESLPASGSAATVAASPSQIPPVVADTDVDAHVSKVPPPPTLASPQAEAPKSAPNRRGGSFQSVPSTVKMATIDPSSRPALLAKAAAEAIAAKAAEGAQGRARVAPSTIRMDAPEFLRASTPGAGIERHVSEAAPVKAASRGVMVAIGVGAAMVLGLIGLVVWLQHTRSVGHASAQPGSSGVEVVPSAPRGVESIGAQSAAPTAVPPESPSLTPPASSSSPASSTPSPSSASPASPKRGPMPGPSKFKPSTL